MPLKTDLTSFGTSEMTDCAQARVSTLPLSPSLFWHLKSSMRWKERHYLLNPVLIIRWWKKRHWALRHMSPTHHQHTTSYCNICQPTNSVWAHLMGHFDIIYIHKWNYGGCGCCLHWQDVKNSWQIKKESRQMCHLLEFKYGTLNKWGPVSIINNPHRKLFWWLFVHLYPLVPGWEFANGMCIYHNMHVFVCETSFQYAHDNRNLWLIQYLFVLDC